MAYNLGVDNPWTGTGGIVATNLMLEAGFTNAPVMAIGIYANTFLKNCLICLSVYLIYKGYKGGKVEMIEAPAFNPVQKKTFIIIVTSLLMLLIPPFLLMFFPQSAFIKTLKTILCIQLIMPAAICVASILKLGEMKNAVKNIPMNTVLLIGGMSILMGVCKEAGLNNAFAAFLGGNLPHWAVKFTLCIAAAFLSFFSGGVSVVVPMLFPLVPQLAATGGFNPTVLYSIIFVGAMSSSCSPFSSGGAQVLSIIPDPEIQNNLTMKMAGFAVGFSIIFSLLSAVGLWDIIPALMGNINY